MVSKTKIWAGIILMIIFISCQNTTTSNDPNEVLQLFFERLAKKDIDGASRYVTSDSKSTMQMLKKGLSMAEKMKDSLPENDPMKDFEDVSFQAAKITGDSAFILVRSKTNRRPDAEFKLLKEKNGWKVDFTMTTLMKMANKSMQSSDDFINDSSGIKQEDVQKGMQMADSILNNMDPKTIEDLKKNLENVK